MTVAAALIALIWLGRYLSGATAPSGPWRQVVGFMVTVKAIVLFWILVTARPGLTADLLFLLFSSLVLPGIYTRWLLVPLGLYRTAFALMRSACPFGSDGDFRANAVLWGALALARAPSHPSDIAWLRARLPSPSLDSLAHDAAEGVLYALAGDDTEARRLFGEVDDFRTGSLVARQAARDWLIIDVLRRRNYEAAIKLGKRVHGNLRWSWVVARIAERLAQKPGAAQDWKLRLLWLVAPRRRATLPLLRAALSVAPVATPVRAIHALPSDLPHALSALAEFVLRQKQTGAQPDRLQFQGIVRTIEGELAKPSWLDSLCRKTAGMPGAPPHAAEAAGQAFQRQLSERLVPLLESWPHLAATVESLPLIKQAIDSIDQRLQRDIQSRCKDYRTRTQERKLLPAAEEQHLWNQLVACATCLLKLSPERRVNVFLEMFSAVNNFAVHMHNPAEGSRLPHEMYGWLFRNAGGNREARDLALRNMQATAPR